MALPWDERMLAALAHFGGEAFATLDGSPKGVGPGTVHELLDVELLEFDGAKGFRTTEAGQRVLTAEIPKLAIVYAFWPQMAGAAARVETPPVGKPSPMKPTPPIPAKKRKSSLLVTQKQVAAVMKGAAQAGVHVEVRIENGVVRFIPCTPEAASPKPRGVTNRSRGFL